MQPKKIAIYSGDVPSTTFINRLIESLANENTIYLFGKQTSKIAASKNIFLCTYTNKLSKLLMFLKFYFLLFFFKRTDKKKLDTIIRNDFQNKLLFKVKFYPVLYHKPDIFHLQWAKSLKDWIWVKEFGMKIVLSLRGTHITISPKADPKLDSIYSKYFPNVDGFHAVSKSMINEIVPYKINPNKIKVIYSGLDYSKLIYNQDKKRESKLKLLSIGRSHWVKGYNYALDACALLKQENIDFEYSIIGVENDEELIFQRDQLQLEKNIFFEKQQSFIEIVNKIQQADIVVLPSVEEGIANVILEAMALGTLVISTNCGGMKEIISDNQNGFLVPIRNAKALAEKIIFVNKLSETELKFIKENARKTIEIKNNE